MVLPDTLAVLEALLLLAADGALPEDLARAADVPLPEIDELLDALDTHYRATGHGLRLQRHDGLTKLVTAPETSPAVARFLGQDRTVGLSAAALDTLAIVAYRQPITRSAVEAIRGVGSEHVLTVLLNLGLIEEIGRADSIGRPVIFGTTSAFLESLGLTSLDELPPLPAGSRDTSTDSG
jgi:segregation and condensation protein B